MTADARLAEMLVNRVRKNRRRLAGWLRDTGVSCYRLYDRDIPEIPLAVDWYEGRLHVAQYEGREGDPEPEPLARALAEALEVDPDGVFVKVRRRQKGSAQYQPIGQPGGAFVVGEGGHRFRVDLGSYLDTGLFLDHRITRARVEAEAAGKRFLNLFCYTGSFTVYAAAGGAVESVSVDLSNTYLDWAAENLRLNELDPSRHRLVAADALALLRSPPVDLGRFDLAVLDPPTFSTSKKMTDVLDVQRDHPQLIRQTLALLEPGGVLYFSTNRRRFRLELPDDLGAEVTDISVETIPLDFRDPKVHRCYRITRRAGA